MATETIATVSEFLREKDAYERNLAREVGRIATSLARGGVMRKDIGQGKYVNLYPQTVLEIAYEKWCDFINASAEDDLENTGAGWDFIGGIN